MLFNLIVFSLLFIEWYEKNTCKNVMRMCDRSYEIAALAIGKVVKLLNSITT